MKGYFYRCASFAILLSLIAGLAACGGTSDGGDTSTAAGADSTDNTGTTAVDLYADLPTGDWGGAEFNIFNTTMSWAYSSIDVDTMTGSALDDAVYERTRSVEEKLGIKINVTEKEIWGGAPNYIKSIIMAGDNSFDALYMAALEAAPMTVENLFIDLYTVDELNFDKPWWDTRTREYYEIDGRLFMVHGDAQINHYEGMWSLYFNKQYIDELSLDSPYDLVNDGSWTLDAMKKMLAAASADIDGSSSMDENDRFGLITHHGSSLAFLHGCDERGIDIENGIYTVAKVDDRMFDAMSLIQKNIFQNKEEVLIKDDKTLFADGHSLFYGEVLGNAKVLRDMDADFGIIPFPKYDEEQENYISYISPASVAMLLPNSLPADRVSRSATVMENFNALSYETVLPAYYEITLTGKSLRDNESAEMLDIMFGSAECELSYVYSWDNYHSTIIDVLTKGQNITSSLEGKRSAVEAKIEALYEAIK